jgi:hypothetical protein
VELAKAELRQSATRAGKGAGLLAGAGISGHLVLLFASVAAWWGIGDATGHGWSALIVAAIWLIVAAILGLMGRREISAVSGVPQTAQTVKKIPGACRKTQGSQRTFCRARSEGQGHGCSVTVRLQHDLRGGRKGIGNPGTGVSGSKPPSPSGGG